MTQLKDNLPHVVLINKADIKKKHFSEDLNNALAAFERRFTSFKGLQLKKYEAGEEGAKRAYQSLVSESTILAQHIYDYFVEDDEQKNDASIQVMADQIKDNLAEGANAGDGSQVQGDGQDKKPDETPPSDAGKQGEGLSDKQSKPAADAEESFSSNDEKVLAKLFKEGKVTGISRKMLSDAGFDTGFWSDLKSTGQRCGKYRLFKKTFEEFYNLEKTA